MIRAERLRAAFADTLEQDRVNVEVINHNRCLLLHSQAIVVETVSNEPAALVPLAA